MINWAKASKTIHDWLRPEPPGVEPFPVQNATSLTERNRFSALLNYRDFDTKDNLCYLDDGVAPSIGFILALNPLMIAGVDAETQLEAVINACPSDTVLQFSVMCNPQVEGFLNTWTTARLQHNTNDLLRQIALRRRQFMLLTATGPSMLPETRLHPRMLQWYLSVRVPYKGDVTDRAELKAFHKALLDLRSTIRGALRSTMIESEVLDESGVKFFLRELLNPHLSPKERILSQSAAAMHMDLIDPVSRVAVQGDGTLAFSRESGEPDVLVSCITTDANPRMLSLPMMADVLGKPEAHDERITSPYFAYTTIHVLDADKAKDNLTVRMGLLNKQTMSESAWYKSMMAHLFERRDMTQEIMAETNKGHRLVRAYSGINIYCPPEEVRMQTEYVKGLWRNVGFRVSEEKYITLPAFMASLPLQYTPTMDPPNRGLQRATLMTSLNAASMIHIQGDWRGTPPAPSMRPDGSVDKFGAGPLFVSRKGQLACFDLLQTQVNYNFVIIATSGSGKSFLANEIVGDFLSKGGIARLIDVGRSYYRFCTIMGGQNVVFDPENPMSLNPFSGIKDQAALNEMMPMLKDLLRLMAYPLTPEDQTPAFQYQILEKAIQEAWNAKGEVAELRDVYEWLLSYEDQQNRTSDLAIQLEPYAVGRYYRWFSGPRTVSFNNPLVVIELEELKQDPNLQAVVLQLVIHQVTKEMYLSDRKIPKLLAIDEAWDLMGGMRTGRFIETSFRRARKYNGIAGVITQSFEDFERSQAAKAAIENAAWQFVLYQRPESLEFAVENKRIVSSDGTLDLLRSVRSGKGYSEVFVRGEQGSGLYRFVTDRHSYYTFTTNPADLRKLAALTNQGVSLVEAIDRLAMEDYKKMWGDEMAAAFSAADV